MIVNIRGTSGSGKSTLARRIMALYDTRAKVHEHGRKQPIMYLCSKLNHRSLAVIGHYETDCGGTDTITSQDKIYDLVRQAANRGYDVLFEGLLISAEFNRMNELAQKHEVQVLHLDVPLKTCLESVNQRRTAKAERTGRPAPAPVNPKNTESKWKGTRRTVERLVEAGIECRSVGREEAFKMARELLHV